MLVLMYVVVRFFVLAYDRTVVVANPSNPTEWSSLGP